MIKNTRFYLAQVRTERVNPHVLSVRINEGSKLDGEEQDRKHLAYLLDRQTIAVVDLTTGNLPIPHKSQLVRLSRRLERC